MKSCEKDYSYQLAVKTQLKLSVDISSHQNDGYAPNDFARILS